MDDFLATSHMHAESHGDGTIMASVYTYVQCNTGSLRANSAASTEWNNIFFLLLSTAAFYYTLANISPQHRSSLDMIQLVTLVKSTDVTAYGIDKILEPFMEAVANLERVCILYHLTVITHST